MATIQEMQKARELMKTQGLDLKTAVAQARTPVASTAPVTPTPAPIQNAPVDTNTGLSKPLEPVKQETAPVVTPTTTPAPVTPEPLQYVNKPDGTPVEQVKSPETVKTPTVASTKVEVPIDYTQAKGREQEIINNLNTFKAQNMTPEQIMKASDYQNATPEKRALIEPYLKVQTPTASAIYNAIATKMDIPDEQKTSLPYKIASNRYAKANMYSTMTPSQLETEIKNAKLVEGSQAYEDLKAMNPKLVQDTENLRKVNGGKTNVFSYVNNPDGTKVKVNNLENTFAQDYIENFQEAIQKMFTVQTPEQIRAIINTPDVIAAQDKATQIELGMNELEKQIENVDKDVEAELKGSGATGSRIALEKSSRKEKLQNEYNSQLKNYTTYANKANNLITQNTTLYTTSQAQKVQQANAMLPILQDQYKTAQSKAQAEQALNDPATQIGQTMQEFEKIGITSQGNIASKIAEFKQSGLSLPEYVNNLRKLYMAKPEYQRIQAQESGKGISYQTIGDKVYKNTNGVLTETGISAKKTAEPVWQEWEDASGKHAGWVTPGVQPSTATASAVKPTGNIVPVTAGNKTVRLDKSGAGGFESAINQLTQAGMPIVVGQGARDQTATIKSMAEQFSIPFNTSNPAETAQKLRSAGHQVADPGKSNHESGMAIDVYRNNKLDAVTPAQEKILNANGWYSAGIPGDAGHFEYRGGTTGTETSQIEKDATLERIRRGQVTDSELGKIQQKAITGGWGTDFTEALKKGMKTTLTDTQIKGLATVDDKIQKDTVLDNVNLVSQQKETIKGLLNTDINANGFNDIALINAFQKIVDPGVSVKEGDVSLLQSSIALKDRLNPSNLLSKVQAGTKLTPENRKQMLDSTVAIYNAQADFGNDLMKKKYYKLADNYGINLADYGYSYDKIDSKGKTIKPISEILPGATGFKSFMSELTTLLQ